MAASNNLPPNHRDIRFDRDREVRIQHHSAKGKVVRNVGSFTRGTQLVRLEYMMVWQGVMVPFFACVGSFALLLCLFMFFRMHEHDTQLVLMRIYAGLWSWCDLSPDKVVNLTLSSGETLDVTMDNLPSNEDVIAAWGGFLRCFVAAGIGSTFLTVPLTMWFTDLAHERGTDILQERHERGAMLVDKDVLVDEIEAYNLEKLTPIVREKYPDYDARKVAAASVERRLSLGLHVPYTIAGIPYLRWSGLPGQVCGQVKLKPMSSCREFGHQVMGGMPPMT